VNKKFKFFNLGLLFFCLIGHAGPFDQISVMMVGISFPNYDPLSKTDNIMINTLTVTGTRGSTVTVTLSCPNVRDGHRYMVNGSQKLRYNYYVDANYTTVWGGSSCRGIASSPITVKIGSSGSTQVPVYAKAPASQDISVGNYTDNLTLAW
jgi:spore coat protein U-like protein